MKKKLKLRKEVRNVLFWVALIAAFTAFVMYATDRNERITNGDLVVIDESYMDR